MVQKFARMTTRTLCLSICFSALFLAFSCRAIRRETASRPVEHVLWDALVKKHVNADGWVNYRGMIADSVPLNQYLKLLRSAHPNDANWTPNEQKAYWINAYNAFTVQLITQHYPIESIKDIKKGIPFVNTVWDIKFIEIEDFTYDLNKIEHQILRPVFKDPRIHAAINCASYSCPRLRAEAYTAAQLDTQLDDAMRSFISDPQRNQITAKKAELSKIFDWFASDFRDAKGSVRAFIKQYHPELGDDVKFDYLDYDWRLNDQAGKG
jgi:Protein of unknown function, DUF547